MFRSSPFCTYLSLLFCITFILISSSWELQAQKDLYVNVSAEQAVFMELEDTVLVYQIANRSLADGSYSRSNYIHPLYSLNGEIITEDFPEDHYHQRGIFWAWHQLYIDSFRIGDGWEINDFEWEVTKVTDMEAGEVVAGISSEVLWKSDKWVDDLGKKLAFVKELTSVIVYPSESHHRVFDISISILALEENMSLGGSEDEKGYGGFSARIKLPDDISFTYKGGQVEPQNTPLNAEGWMDFSGSLGKSEERSGFTIIPHKDNSGYPNPWILRSKNSMQNAVFPYPGAQPIKISTSEPIVLKYRMVVHEGSLSPSDIEVISDDFQEK